MNWRPTEEMMRRMRERLARLEWERKAYEGLWFGPELIPQVDSDIYWQKKYIEDAIKINPALAEVKA
jgi:hypothetical protein